MKQLAGIRNKLSSYLVETSTIVVLLSASSQICCSVLKYATTTFAPTFYSSAYISIMLSFK